MDHAAHEHVDDGIPDRRIVDQAAQMDGHVVSLDDTYGQ
jgi:hypothetical protein